MKTRVDTDVTEDENERLGTTFLYRSMQSVGRPSGQVVEHAISRIIYIWDLGLWSHLKGTQYCPHSRSMAIRQKGRPGGPEKRAPGLMSYVDLREVVIFGQFGENINTQSIIHALPSHHILHHEWPPLTMIET